MEMEDLLGRCLLLDLEASHEGRLLAIGAVRKGEVLARQGSFAPAEACAELDRLAEGAEFLLGHNLLDFDLPLLSRLEPGLALLRLPVVDTLFLSPLAFPKNPYHHLVKDYKLVRDAKNDPVADARRAARLFADQWRAFAATNRAVLAFYRLCFAAATSTGDLAAQGLTRVFGALGAPAFSPREGLDWLTSRFQGIACDEALAAAGEEAFGERPRAGFAAALAYAVAWLQVAGGDSVLPPWVRHRFAAVPELLARLRERPCDRADCPYCTRTHDLSAQSKSFYGFEHFRSQPALPDGRPFQEGVIRAALAGRSLLAILPTGGGKSLCFQLPALIRHQRRGVLTIVLSPLQALMKDQVDALEAKSGRRSAAALYGLLTLPERGDVLERVRLGGVALLYVSPEQLRNRSFRRAVAEREIGAWVFDEAHCLSKWGHDFRPDYLYAARFIRERAAERAEAPQILCLTATAKREVQEEIRGHFQRELGLELDFFAGGVERSNLRFEVRPGPRARRAEEVHWLLMEKLGRGVAGGATAAASGQTSRATGSAVVYAATRRSATRLGRELEQRGWSAASFHGGLPAAEKRRVQEAFLGGGIEVVVATNAFGMGIDKSDVRLVAHAEIPGSLESYLQEAGRAGRDQHDADCVLLYDPEDVETQFQLGALGRLERRDVAEILRGLRRLERRLGRSQGTPLVLTPRELLRDDELETEIDSTDPYADNKVKTAVAWLERAGFLERDDNDTRIFQGRPRVASLEEARAKLAGLGLSAAQRERWLAILGALFAVDEERGLAVDELAELPACRPGPDALPGEAAKRILATLEDMATAGLIERGLRLSAVVRWQVADASQKAYFELAVLERTLLDLLRDAEPDPPAEEFLPLSLRRLNQRLVDAGQVSHPALLRRLLAAFAERSPGDGAMAALELRIRSADQLELRLPAGWTPVRAGLELRQSVAGRVLEAILGRVPVGTPPNAKLLVAFTLEDVTATLAADLELAGRLVDPLAAAERGLLDLHERGVIRLQQGLAVFRQAMTVRLLPTARRRSYGRGDFAALEAHYRERIFQVHVMNEYARRGLAAMGDALRLALAYFELDKGKFVARFFADRKEVLARATGEDSYQKLVERLGHPVQEAVVAASPGSNQLVLAGPGTGKTRVVVHRAAYLLRVERVRPQSLLVLCFNRAACSQLRRRLRELVGADARGVTIATFHGLAMRLTGASFADRLDQANEPGQLDDVVPAAVRLLRGEAGVPGFEAEELGDRLLGGLRHLLVDEYQDVDHAQVELVAAIAGRTEKDPDRRLSLLAVGDDDQSIYGFRGANLEFIQRFCEDYQAEVSYLLESYRATANVLAVAGQVIRRNRARMKTEQSITVDRARASADPGGRWGTLDALARGRVQVLECPNEAIAAAALVEEFERLRALDGDAPWTGFAVLARRRAELAAVRAAFEARGIPVSWALDRSRLPPLNRVREMAAFFAWANEHRAERRTASRLLAPLVTAGEPAAPPNAWRALLVELLEDWREETGDAELAVAAALEHLAETLFVERRELALGRGVYLGTVHAAKGLEFPHVAVLGGGWPAPYESAELEEERRVIYVAMTRAQETLLLVDRRDAPNGHLGGLGGAALLRRAAAPGWSLPAEAAGLSYEVLALSDLYLGFAGRLAAHDPVHAHLAALGPGGRLELRMRAAAIQLVDEAGITVAHLSQNARERWRSRLDEIAEVRVVAMLERRATDGDEAYRSLCRVERWEVPLVEVIVRVQARDSG